MPVKWALRDQVSGIERTSNGQSLPVQRALSAQSIGRFLGNSCGSAAYNRYPQKYVPTQPLLHGDVIFPTSRRRDSCVVMQSSIHPVRFFNPPRQVFRSTPSLLCQGRTLKKMPIFGKTNENAVSFYTCEQFSDIQIPSLF